MNTLGAESVWYRLSIYFYLHFLYNGWMIMALLGLCLHLFEQRGIRPSKIIFKKLFWCFNLGIVLSFFLSTLFTKPPILLSVLGGVGGAFQLFALILLVRF